MPRVSVITPIYNGERFLSSAIESIRAQTFRDFEMLLFDDGSKDRSVQIAREASRVDSRIMLVQGEHQGVVHWRNAGIASARGEFVAMMDADDVSLPARLESQVRYLEQHPECCALGSQAVRVDEDGFPIDTWRVPERHEAIDEHHLFKGGGAIINPSVMMRKSAVVQIGGYRPGYDSSEDYDLFLRLAEIGSLANLAEILLNYRVHVKSLTFAKANYQQERMVRALRETWARRRLAIPFPEPLIQRTILSEEELVWEWARSAFAARNFRTAQRQSFRLLRKHPSDVRCLFFFLAVCAGPLAHGLKRFLPYRVGCLTR